MKWRLMVWVILLNVTGMMLFTGCAEAKFNRSKLKNTSPENPCACVNKGHSAVTPVPRPYPYWMARHNSILERNKQGNVGMVFIGNSLTQRWEGNGVKIWNEYYGNRNAVNMGFDGDATQNVLWRLDHGEIDGISPKVAVLLIGSNHVNGYTIEEISDGIKAICCRIRTKLPKTKILLLAILPRGDASAAAAYRLNKASEEASKIVDNRTIFYLNMSEKFLDPDGNVSKELMVVDGVHLTEKGYRLLAQTMEPALSKLLDERAPRKK